MSDDLRARITAEVMAEHRAKPWWVRLVEWALDIPRSCIENRVAFSGGK